MKTNSLMRVASKPLTLKTKQHAVGNHLTQFNNSVDQLWQMYQAQLQRNGELMVIIDRQQQFIQQFITDGVSYALKPATHPLALQQATTPIPIPEFKDLNVSKLNEYTILFKKLYDQKVKRLDGIHSLIKVLYTVHQLGGAACPEQLFEKAGIAKSTGFRSTTFLQDQWLIAMTGGKYDARYKISLFGRQFLVGTLECGYDKQIQDYPTQEEGQQAWKAYSEGFNV